MIVHQRNIFINDYGKQYEIPLEYVSLQGGFSHIIEFAEKIIIEFSGSKENDTRLRNIICFDRSTSEVLWLIEQGKGWVPEYNNNMYLVEDAEDYLPYSSVTAFHGNDKGHLWVEEDYNQDQQNKKTYKYLLKKKLIARHPYYHNDNRYRFVENKAYWIRSDTHELVLRDWNENDNRTLEERGYSDMAYYTDMTAYAEDDCLLVAISNGGTFLFDTDLETGKVKPAYAMTGETK